LSFLDKKKKQRHLLLLINLSAPEAHNWIPNAEGTVAPPPDQTSFPKTGCRSLPDAGWVFACAFGVPAVGLVLFCTTCPDLAGSKKLREIVIVNFSGCNYNPSKAFSCRHNSQTSISPKRLR